MSLILCFEMLDACSCILHIHPMSVVYFLNLIKVFLKQKNGGLLASCHATVHHIWIQRNKIVHGELIKSEESILFIASDHGKLKLE